MYDNILLRKNLDKSIRRIRDKRIKDGIEEAKYKISNGTINSNPIAKRLIPKLYKDRYLVNNLWRHTIGSYRLLYTIISEDGMKKYAILDVLTHKEYDELFGYHTS